VIGDFDDSGGCFFLPSVGRTFVLCVESEFPWMRLFRIVPFSIFEGACGRIGPWN